LSQRTWGPLEETLEDLNPLDMIPFDVRVRPALARLLFCILLLAGLGPGIDLRGAVDGRILTVGNVYGAPGNQVLVPVSVKQFSNILTLQFSFHWEATNAIFVGVEQFGLPRMSVAGNFGFPSNGVLTVSWEEQTFQ